MGCKIKKNRRIGEGEERVELLSDVPEEVLGCFDMKPDFHDRHKTVVVSLGLFSVVKIIRNTEILIPSYGHAPLKSCNGERDDEPCSLFSRIHFPMDEFFPPESKKFPKYEAFPSSTLDERIKKYPKAESKHEMYPPAREKKDSWE